MHESETLGVHFVRRSYPTTLPFGCASTIVPFVASDSRRRGKYRSTAVVVQVSWLTVKQYKSVDVAADYSKRDATAGASSSSHSRTINLYLYRSVVRWIAVQANAAAIFRSPRALTFYVRRSYFVKTFGTKRFGINGEQRTRDRKPQKDSTARIVAFPTPDDRRSPTPNTRMFSSSHSQSVSQSVYLINFCPSHFSRNDEFPSAPVLAIRNWTLSPITDRSSSTLAYRNNSQSAPKDHKSIQRDDEFEDSRCLLGVPRAVLG
jgi:hypothetical protein